MKAAPLGCLVMLALTVALALVAGVCLPSVEPAWIAVVAGAVSGGWVVFQLRRRMLRRAADPAWNILCALAAVLVLILLVFIGVSVFLSK